jgi:hypothetical protein
MLFKAFKKVSFSWIGFDLESRSRRAVMEQFTKLDVKDLLEKLENGLDSIPKLDKVEKMRMRGKIRQQESWLLAFANPTPQKVRLKLESRLSEIFRLYPHGFADDVSELLKMKVAKLKEK